MLPTIVSAASSNRMSVATVGPLTSRPVLASRVYRARTAAGEVNAGLTVDTLRFIPFARSLASNSDR
jgi:hypothetical protein